MNKTLGIILVIAVTIIAAAISWEYTRQRTVDWAESYNEKSNKPYGVSIFYRELPQLFPGQKVRTIYHAPYDYFYANSAEGYGDHIAEGNYILVGNSDYLVQGDIEELLIFASRGNTIFLSDYNFPKPLLDTLNLALETVHNKDSITHLSFKDPTLGANNIDIDRNPIAAYFSHYDADHQKALGHINKDLKHVNFLEIPFEKGRIYLHLEPKVFTNYNLLMDTRYRYVEGLLSYLPNGTIYFDSYTKYSNSYYGDGQEKSNLSWFLQQPSFRWAWYLAVLLTFLFMIFNAKRRQRIIPIIKPMENTTVGFVKTVSNLYYETQDHKNLIDKKITYFLEKIRSDYHLDTTHLNEEFIKKLAQKSGKSIASVKKTINFITWLRSKQEFHEENLLKLNDRIEAFYSK